MDVRTTKLLWAALESAAEGRLEEALTHVSKIDGSSVTDMRRAFGEEALAAPRPTYPSTPRMLAVGEEVHIYALRRMPNEWPCFYEFELDRGGPDLRGGLFERGRVLRVTPTQYVVQMAEGGDVRRFLRVDGTTAWLPGESHQSHDDTFRALWEVFAPYAHRKFGARFAECRAELAQRAATLHLLHRTRGEFERYASSVGRPLVAETDPRGGLPLVPEVSPSSQPVGT